MALDQGRRSRLGSVLLVVAGVIAGVVAAYGAAAQLTGRTEPPPGPVIVLAMVALMSLPAHIVLHELGHLLAALATRLQVTEVAVMAGPDTRVRTIARTRVQIGWRGRHSHVRFGAPPHQTAVRARTIIVVLAGPMANIATAVACWGLADSTADLLARTLWFAFGVGASLMGIINLVPAKLPEAITGATDGLLLVRWLSRPEGLRTALTLEHLAWRGRDPRNHWRRFEDLRLVRQDLPSAEAAPKAGSAPGGSGAHNAGPAL